MDVHGTMISSLFAGCHQSRHIHKSWSVLHSLAVMHPTRAHISITVREASHDAHAPPDLLVQSFNHVVHADRPTAPVRELQQQVGRGLAAIPSLRCSFAAACSALSRADSRDSMANTAWSNCIIPLDMAPHLFPIAVFHCLATENRTRHGPCLFHQGRNPKIRKNSDVTYSPRPDIKITHHPNITQ